MSRATPQPISGAHAFVALAALADERLSRSTAGRIGTVGVVLVALVATAEILATPVGRSGAGIASGSASLLAWLGAGPALLAAAGGQAHRDRREGVEELARLRGHTHTRLLMAKVLGTAMLVARRVGGPALLLSGLAAARAGVLAGLPRQLAALAIFAIVAGLGLAALAEGCARLGSKRSTSLFVAVIAVPWAIAEPLGHPSWSIPGALGWALGSWTGGVAASAWAPLAGSWRLW